MTKFSDLAPGQGRYVNAADKAALADAEAALRIVGVKYQARAAYGPRWLVEVAVIGTGELVDIDFAAASKEGEPIEARTTLFGAVRDILDAGGEVDPVMLASIAPAKGGNPFWTFVDASPEDIAAARVPEWPERPEPAAPPANPPVLAGEKLRKAAR